MLKDALEANPLAIRDMLRSTDPAAPQGLMARMKASLEKLRTGSRGGKGGGKAAFVPTTDSGNDRGGKGRGVR